MIENVFKKILVLGPHTDDGEIGAGGTISKLIKMGSEVHYATFSLSEESLPKGLPKDTLAHEVKEASKILGIKLENLYNYKYKVRKLNFSRQDILEDIIKLRNKIEPTLVITPCSYDIHQDHKTIYEESLRAFKKTNVIGYELPWNNMVIDNRCFIEISVDDIQTKFKSIKAYKSQDYRDYMSEEYIKALAIVRGKQISVDYAESFEVIRLIIK
jgi:LmbE family N-acetylglucosaminyl deacetylase